MERIELGLAYIGLGEADVRRLRAMLMMAVADGSLRAHWSLVEARHANVIIVGAEMADQVERFARNNRLAVVLVGVADRVPPGTPTLSWPIRVEALLDLLGQAEARFVSPGGSTSERPLIRLAHLLRCADHDGASAGNAWRVTGLSRTPIYIAPQRRQFFFTESLRSVHRFDLNSDIELTPLPLTELPIAREHPKPIVMLQWSIGLLTGAFGPLPWLKSSATMRLQRFPEFQILHHEPVHRRLAAAFSRPVVGIDAAVQLTSLNRQAVCSFVNGAELCGYLRTSDAPALPASAPARVANGSRRSLAQLLRRALGIETTHG